VNACADVYQRHAREVSEYDTGSTAQEIYPKEAPTRPIAAQVFPAKRVKENTQRLDLYDFSKEGIDRGFTKTLFADHFVDTKKQWPDGIPFPEEVDEATLSEEEKEFLEILRAEQKEFAEDCKKGAKINKKRKFYALNDTAKLQGKLEKEIQNLEGEL